MTPRQKKPDASEPTLTAAAVRDATGLSYRQLNDWDSKGTLPSQREQGSSWRRFTWREIFILTISKEIRDRFGTPLESLAFVQKCMLQKGANHFQAAVEIMQRGMVVFLLTDFRETFVMGSDVEFERLFRGGMLRGSEDQGFIFIQVNSIVNRLLECLENPVALRIHNKFYGAIAQAKAGMTVRDQEELTVIRAVRDRDYKRIVLTKKGGEDMVLEVEQELPTSGDAKNKINDLLAEHDFQTVTVSRVAGKNVRLVRKLPIPLRRSKKV
jgi:hypothetical protein